MLTSVPVLAYTDFSLPFVLQTDGSLKGLGAVLTQMEKECYLFCQSAPQGKRVESVELQFLQTQTVVADTWTEFLLLTDNNPLVYLLTAKLGGQAEQNIVSRFTLERVRTIPPGGRYLETQ